MAQSRCSWLELRRSVQSDLPWRPSLAGSTHQVAGLANHPVTHSASASGTYFLRDADGCCKTARYIGFHESLAHTCLPAKWLWAATTLSDWVRTRARVGEAGPERRS